MIGGDSHSDKSHGLRVLPADFLQTNEGPPDAKLGMGGKFSGVKFVEPLFVGRFMRRRARDHNGFKACTGSSQNGDCFPLRLSISTYMVQLLAQRFAILILASTTRSGIS